MAIQDDVTIDLTNQTIKYTGGFTGENPDSIYSMNELYTYLQDFFDEPSRMDDPVPMTAQTPNEYTLLYPWFIDDESIRAFFGGSLVTSGWAFNASAQTGVTGVHWTTATDAPTDADIGVALTQAVSGATGTLLDVDTDRNVAWIKNTNGTQFNATNAITGTGVDFTSDGVTSGASGWHNIFSLGNVVTDTEIYVVQVNNTFEVSTPVKTKLTSYWNEDVSFVDPNGFGGADPGQIDLMIKTNEGGSQIDGGRLVIYARQYSKTYNDFGITASATGSGRTPVPLSTSADLNNDNLDSGYRQNIATGTSGTLNIGDTVTGGTSGAEGVVLDTNGTTTFEYYLIGQSDSSGDLVDFGNSESLSNGAGWTGTSAAGGSTNVGPSVANGVTVTFGYNGTFDINQDSTNENYACVINCNSQSLEFVYNRLKYLTRRGQTTDIDDGTQSVIGEIYRAVGDMYSTYDAEGVSGPPNEGEAVTATISGAKGIVTAVEDNGTTGSVVIRNTRGTFVDNDVVQADADSNRSVTLSQTPATIVPVAGGGPFGTFAGGSFFFARGIVPNNVQGSEANNYQVVTIEGTTITPPTSVAVTVSNLLSLDGTAGPDKDGDRVAVFRLTGAGGSIAKSEFTLTTGNNENDTDIVIDSDVNTDTPNAGVVRIVDNTNNLEFRHRYSSITSGANAVFNLIDGGSGTATSADTGTTLTDTAADFGGTDDTQVGDIVYNVTDGSWGVITSIASNGQSLTHTQLSGGIGNDWGISDAYKINNALAANFTTGDNAYVPLLDSVIDTAATSSSNTLNYDTNIAALVRVRRNRDGGAGFERILPFETEGTVDSGGLSVAAIRTEDTISS